MNTICHTDTLYIDKFVNKQYNSCIKDNKERELINYEKNRLNFKKYG